MTLGEAIVEVYEGSDEQSDLNPYDIAGAVDLTKPQTLKIMSALQRGMNLVSTWKFKNGVRIRFRRFETTRYFSSKVFSYVVPAGFVVGSRIVTLPLALDGSNDRFKDFVFSVNSSQYVVYSSNATTISLTETIDEDITGETFNLYQRFFNIGTGLDDIALQHRIVQVTKITNMKTSTDMEPVGIEKFSTDLASTGSPTQYSTYANGIMFNSAPDEVQLFRLIYYRYPSMPATVNEQFEFPDAFHEPIVLWAKKWALERIGETQRGYATWNLFEETLNAIRTESDIESDYIDSRLYPKE